MTFEYMALVTTFAGVVLGLGFLFAGRFMLEQWGVAATDGSLLMGRRIGAVYLGLALVFYLGRLAGPSELRSALCAGIGVALGLLASLGLFELKSRRVNKGIFVSVVVETLLSFGFFWTLWRQP